MTRKALLITEDNNLRQFVEISAMTLTKLNCQTEINTCTDAGRAEKLSGEDNLDLILLDLDLNIFSPLQFLKDVRQSEKSKRKKLIAFSADTGKINKQEIFDSGCDSIMSKDELRASLNNLLQY